MGNIVLHIITDLHMKNIDGDVNHKESIGEQGLFYSVPANFRSFATIANKEQPDFVLSLGDCIHGSCPPDKFMEIWDSIEAPKAITPGNHDLDVYKQIRIADYFGYNGVPVKAGSPFHKSYVIRKEKVSCRIIMLDSSFDVKQQSGNHWQNCQLHDSALDWIKEQLGKNKEDYILLCSHVSPHHYKHVKNFYNDRQAKQIANIVTNYVNRNQEVNVISFAGHAHPEAPEFSSSLGSGFPGVIFPSMIRHKKGTPGGGPNGVYSVVTLEPNDYRVQMKWLPYTE
ncbi:Calcineurin-like phosphoesterase [Gracilibacillus ureilyticus]|uniref:Calcineurin-like phosphoesterase n=1 Tax=Gracilibacillus ureilyticus TaxID=531814 RepID=A0A1H9UT36_9BACI|nr:metallophosphoesterase [Gracilibacillus ureilyticus]SES12690.1 Calcineurin-like phosphoesterase [Gracilibacillus ureilyticus]